MKFLFVPKRPAMASALVLGTTAWFVSPHAHAQAADELAQDQAATSVDARHSCFRAAGMDGDPLARACDICQQGVAAHGRMTGKTSVEYVEWLAHLARCRAEQARWNDAYIAINEAKQVAEANGIAPPSINLATTFESIDKRLLQVQLQLSDAAKLPDMSITLGNDPPYTNLEQLQFVLDGPTTVVVAAPCYVSRTLQVTPTAGTPAVVEVPVLARVDYECPPPPPPPPEERNAPVFATIGLIGITVSLGSLMLAGGAAIYKGGVDYLECENGCSPEANGKKNGATPWVTGGLWTAAIAGGIGFPSLIIGATRNEKFGSRPPSNRATALVVPLVGRDTGGLVVTGSF